MIGRAGAADEVEKSGIVDVEPMPEVDAPSADNPEDIPADSGNPEDSENPESTTDVGDQ